MRKLYAMIAGDYKPKLTFFLFAMMILSLFLGLYLAYDLLDSTLKKVL